MTQSSIPLPSDEPVADSHVGSLLGPISRIRDAYDWAADSFASDKYRQADHATWRPRMLAQVFESMSYSPAKTDPNPQVVEKLDFGTYIREKIYFNTTPELRVPAYVLVPKNLKGKAPALIALHSHGGFYRWGKEKFLKLPGEHETLTEARMAEAAGHATAEDVVNLGYVVIMIDAFYWGERRMRFKTDPPIGPGESVADIKKFNADRWEQEYVVAKTIYTAGYTWAGLMVWDDIRTVDYLLTRPEVDPDRIGCFGQSMGGWRAAHLMAMDDRVKAGVVGCWLTSYKDLTPNHVMYTVGYTMVFPGIYRYLDMPDVVSLAAPRAVLCINGEKDGLFPLETGVKPAYKTLEAVYAKLGAADKFRAHLYNTPHEFNPTMQQEAWDWFNKHL